MREYKFRGRRADNGEWVYGDLVHVSYKTYIKDINDKTTNPRRLNGFDNTADVLCIGVDHKTVGQYTGLHDKNGKEIYEGDILKPPTNLRNRVVFGVKGGFAVETLDADVGTYGKSECYVPIEGLSDEQNAAWAETCEVIGNIHENSELLKEVESGRVLST